MAIRSLKPAVARAGRRRAVRSVALAAAGVAVAVIAAGCSAPAEPVEAASSIDILIPDVSTNIVDPAFEVINDAWTEESGITVNWVNSGGDYGAVEESILAARLADDMPDAAIISSASIRTYADAGLAQPLNALMDADTGFDPESVEGSLLTFGEYDDQIYGLPLTASWVVMYYNVAIFTAAGLDPDDPPQNFSELEDAARQIVESGAAPQGFGFRFVDDPNMWRFQNLVSSGGGSLMDGDELTLTDPGVLEVVDFLSELAEDEIVSLYDSPTITEAFRRGDLAITYDASSSARSYAENTPFEYRVAPYPIPDGGERVLPAGGASIVMFTDDPARQQAVWEAIRQLVGPDGGEAYLAEQAGGVVVLDKSANAAWAEEHEALQLTADDIDSFRPMFQFPGSSAQEIWKILGDGLLDVLKNGKDPEDAMTGVEDASEPLL